MNNGAIMSLVAFLMFLAAKIFRKKDPTAERSFC
jgi:hypothetical protein